MWLVTRLMLYILRGTKFCLQPVDKQKHFVGKAKDPAMMNVFIMSLSGPLLCQQGLTSESLFTHVSLTYCKRQIIGTSYVHSLSDTNCTHPVMSETGTPTSPCPWAVEKLFNSSMCRCPHP